jgi:uncharacterized protein
MTADPLSTWLGFQTSPAAPKGTMSPMELDGYLTGIVVSPDQLRPRDWLGGIWGQREPAFDSLVQAQTVMAAVMGRYNAIVEALDAGFKQIEAGQPADYRPLFVTASDTPNHDVVRAWVRGFSKAMALAPEGWTSLAEDKHLQTLLTPFIGFLEFRDSDFDPADNMDDLLDEAATAIPRAAIVLRKIAQFNTERTARRYSKVGRNDPCPCGSGLKYKRCCGAGQAAPN